MDVTQLPLIDVAALESGTESSGYGGEPRVQPRRETAPTCVEPDDLARFEGEGGLQAPEPVSCVIKKAIS